MDFIFFTSLDPQFISLRILLIFFLTVATVRIVLRVINKKEFKLHYLIIRKLLVVVVVIIGAVLIMEQIPGFNNVFATILTGSGIAALAISLAAQQSLSNFISGMVISASKPFEVGDRVRLINGNITGNIEDITLRHTVVRTFMNSRIIVPNALMNNDMIENANIIEERASNFLDITITYDSDMEKAMEIIAEKIGAHPDYVDVREPEEMDQPLVPVYVRNLGIYGVELRASVWTGSVRNNFVTCSEIRHQLKPALERAGIKFAVAPVAAPPNS